MRLSEYLGIDLEYIVLGLAGIVVFEFLLILINMVTVAKVKRNTNNLWVKQMHFLWKIK